MKGLIITGGSISDTFAASYFAASKYSRVIAVDHGLEAADRLGIKTDIVVGDFDSVDPSVLKRYQKDPQVRFESHSPIKDFSDTELAIDLALQERWDEIDILGGTGSRLDHTLTNIHLLLAPLAAGIPCYITDPYNRIYLLDQGKTFYKKECFGPYLSFLPLTTEVKGITLRGFSYPLTDKDIRIGTSLCISNELKEDSGTIRFNEGILICMETRDHS